MKKVISAPQNSIKETIYLPSSKSISNRMLIMQALSLVVPPKYMEANKKAFALGKAEVE